MAQIEKSVFISYRRTNKYHAWAVYQALISDDYNVFIDYDSIGAGLFKPEIFDAITKREHFILILTPTTLDRCHREDDFLRFEIEKAIQHKRNIIPLAFDGFEWNKKYILKLPDTLKTLPDFQLLPVPHQLTYFNETIDILQNRFLSKSVDSIHILSNEDPSDGKESFEKANQFYLKRKYENAIPLYNNAIKSNPNNLSAYYLRGVCYQKTNQREKAFSDYDFSIKRANEILPNDINNAEAYKIRGMSYSGKGELDLALKDLNKAIIINPRDPNLYNNRGIIYMLKGEYDNAIKDFNEALLIDPNTHFVKHNLRASFLRRIFRIKSRKPL